MDLADDDEMKLLCHPLQCGGLEITDLKVFVRALRLRWL
jgi:hypothetical protein